MLQLLDRIPGSVNEHHQARERSETDEQKAQALISARLKKLGWEKVDLGASAQERPPEGSACESSALANYNEFEMDRPTLGNGVMDARLQSSSPINASPLCQK